MANDFERYDLEAMLLEIEEDEGGKKVEKAKALSQDEIMKMLREKKRKGKSHE